MVLSWLSLTAQDISGIRAVPDRLRGEELSSPSLAAGQTGAGRSELNNRYSNIASYICIAAVMFFQSPQSIPLIFASLAFQSGL